MDLNYLSDDFSLHSLYRVPRILRSRWGIRGVSSGQHFNNFTHLNYFCNANSSRFDDDMISSVAHLFQKHPIHRRSFSVQKRLAVTPRQYWKNDRCYMNAANTGSTACTSSGFETEPYDDSSYPSIPVSDFPEHVRRLHADGDIGFAKEFENLDHLSATAETMNHLVSESSIQPVNKPKNRYINILAYEHSRVVLSSEPGRLGSDYVNANFVDGFHKPRAYIATQGPLPGTFGDFWRMVWEQRCMVIVMITNIMERGRRKCDQYWPSIPDATEFYGSFQLKLLSEHSTAHYAVRMLSLKNMKIKAKSGERIVFQYHYTHWPDHGVPDHPLPVLTFIRKSSAANRDTAGPMIVHCSAGVGRSGTYIVIESMLRQIKARNTVNVYAFLKHIRKQRNFLVQTEEQYVFCHDAIIEAYKSDVTEINACDLRQFVDERLIDTSVALRGLNLLQKEYSLVKELEFRDHSTHEADKPSNALKNRSPDHVPLDHYRVPLAPRPGEEGSDYINATFLNGFHKNNEYIMTQVPLANTVQDFWRLIWDYNCQTVVLLADLDNNHFQKFWPELAFETLQCGSFYVYMTESATSGDLTCIDFALQSTKDEFQFCCRLLHFPSWPSVCYPFNTTFNLVRTVQDLQNHEYQNGPIVVVDRFGHTEAAQFCVLLTLTSQLEQDCSVDVYQVAKLYHSRRPGVFETCDDYYFLYRAVRILATDSFLSPSTETTSSLTDVYNSCNNNCPVLSTSMSLPCGEIKKAAKNPASILPLSQSSYDNDNLSNNNENGGFYGTSSLSNGKNGYCHIPRDSTL